MIEATHHVLKIPNLPASLRGFQVTHLTDLHRSRYTQDRLLHRAVAMANAANADLILITGDFVTRDPADIEPCAQIVSHLRARHGVYASLGNHDYTADARAVEHALTHQGIHVLINRNVQVKQGLHIVGLDDDRHGKPDIDRAFTGVGEGEPVLAMIHNPAYAEALAERECIAFSGHTHGGQICVPVLTDREVRRIGAKHYREGWFTVGKTRLYVNRGIGKVGLPFRFRCRPEIAHFTLTD